MLAPSEMLIPLVTQAPLIIVQRQTLHVPVNQRNPSRAGSS